MVSHCHGQMRVATYLAVEARIHLDGQPAVIFALLPAAVRVDEGHAGAAEELLLVEALREVPEYVVTKSPTVHCHFPGRCLGVLGRHVLPKRLYMLRHAFEMRVLTDQLVCALGGWRGVGTWRNAKKRDMNASAPASVARSV